MKSLLLMFSCVLLMGATTKSSSTAEPTIFGKWITIDDETNKKKSVVEIFERDGKVYGKIVKLYPREGRGPNPKCDKCTDDRKDQPLVGLEIIRDMEKDDDEYEDGTICDPENGKIYDCALWLNEDNTNRLMVRGYLGFFYRTQIWVRLPE
ncbi:Uncharacterized conserved protein, DUF2147 family [Lishizhenia tianjinensis]|uniref:Uncharacterized conserved protein, DUF2147 family n=1 Tax=Lishizhenia tianjinensis TaxID=477690 RepID=A0A1I6XJP4_9FLAO|nr:DUF2147 domain-containing protein [Lishizhenia tianjinensis]SFT38074.1 Uncharacterized conserved protein, DUF2147 family [Lishizhenia tianjinensis]